MMETEKVVPKTYFNAKGLEWFLKRVSKEGLIDKNKISEIKTKITVNERRFSCLRRRNVYGKEILCSKGWSKDWSFYSWDECKLQVEGFSNPVFKSFNSKLEAEKYLGIEDNEDSLLSEIKRFADVEIEKSNRINIELNNYDIALYVDGSYNKNNCKYGSGFVAVDILKKRNII